MRNALIINWKSTLVGFLGGLILGAIDAYSTGQFQPTFKSFAAWAVPFGLGLIAKDFNKSNAPSPLPEAMPIPPMVAAPDKPSWGGPGPYSNT